MTQDEIWLAKYHEYVNFVKDNQRCPSKHFLEEHRLHSRWKHNRQLLNAGTMKLERREMFKRLMALAEDNRHVNQYE